jgi:hypothetical protein
VQTSKKTPLLVFFTFRNAGNSKPEKEKKNTRKHKKRILRSEKQFFFKNGEGNQSSKQRETAKGFVRKDGEKIQERANSSARQNKRQTCAARQGKATQRNTEKKAKRGGERNTGRSSGQIY